MTHVELHCHSAYSFLDGVSLPGELVEQALTLGHDALALTDHNSVAGSMEHAIAARELGLRAIHGAELDLDDGRHVTLLVRDARGWRNLCRLITHAHRRDRLAPAVTLPLLAEHAEGLVCLSGCATHGVHDEGTLRRLRDSFGPRDLRVELQRPFARHDRARNRALQALARRLHVACVATGDVHAHHRRRAGLQDAFVAIRCHSTLEACEAQRRPNHSHVLTTPEAMARRFADHPDAVRAARELAEELRFELEADLGYRYPGADDETAPRRLAELCGVRLDERYGPSDDVARARLEEELRVIEKLGLAGFFLLHHDMLLIAREVAAQVRGADAARALLAPGRGRGSSVSSIVCYLTGLSHIDPIANDLLLGRFLHEELTALPDIDLDFPRDIRERLIPRIHDRYGRDRAALVAAFPTYRTRGAIRELGRALGLAAADIERVARGAEGHPGCRLASDERVARDVAQALGPERVSGRWAWLAILAAEAYGLPRHISQHPGGMVISTRPLIDCCPIVPAAMDGRQMVQWDKDSCADAGFLKIDLLGLGMLSAVERCVALIAHERGERVDLSRIPFDDPQTFEAIADARTTGSFQIESRAQMQSLRRTRPRNLDDLTIQVAIVRPGPIQGGAVNPYIDRLQRLRADPSFQVPYEHSSLEGVLEETLGTIIFQDQVIEVAQAFAGFSPGQADALRRAMSRKRSAAALEAQRERFIAGAQRTVGADRATAQRVWEKIAGFAGFGFPKSHSAAFGLLAYQSTWLRVHYGPELLCALLDEQPMGFYPPDSLIHEAQRRGIEVRGPDVNHSQAHCTLEDGAVRIGLGYVRSLTAADAQRVVDARAAHGPFRSLDDVASRTGCSRAVLERLAWAGTCDDLVDDHRRGALWRLGAAATSASSSGGTQLELEESLPAAPPLRPLERMERIVVDYATTSVTVEDHVMAALRRHLRGPLQTSAQLERLPHGCSVSVAGLVVARQRPSTANGIVFLLLEDEWGAVNVVVRPPLYERRRLLVRAEPLLVVRGRLERPERGGGAVSVLAGELWAADDGAARAQVRPLADGQRADIEAVAAGDLRAVAPPAQSFAAGRRR